MIFPKFHQKHEIWILKNQPTHFEKALELLKQLNACNPHLCSKQAASTRGLCLQLHLLRGRGCGSVSLARLLQKGSSITRQRAAGAGSCWPGVTKSILIDCYAPAVACLAHRKPSRAPRPMKMIRFTTIWTLIQIYYTLGPMTFLHSSLLGGLGVLKAENRSDVWRRTKIDIFLLKYWPQTQKLPSYDEEQYFKSCLSLACWVQSRRGFMGIDVPTLKTASRLVWFWEQLPTWNPYKSNWLAGWEFLSNSMLRTET